LIHHPHSLFQQPPRQQAIAAEVGRLRVVEPVHLARGCGLGVDIGDFRHGQLHFGRQLVSSNTRTQGVVRVALVEMPLVEFGE
jgi:hypothetical protein